MTAGTGISHSEYNASQTEPVHFLQIWILPDERGLKPGYEQKEFSLEKNPGTWTLIGAKDGRDDSLAVQPNVDIYAARLVPKAQAMFHLKPRRRAFMQWFVA